MACVHCNYSPSGCFHCAYGIGNSSARLPNINTPPKTPKKSNGGCGKIIAIALGLAFLFALNDNTSNTSKFPKFRAPQQSPSDTFNRTTNDQYDRLKQKNSISAPEDGEEKTRQEREKLYESSMAMLDMLEKPKWGCKIMNIILPDDFNIPSSEIFAARIDNEKKYVFILYKDNELLYDERTSSFPLHVFLTEEQKKSLNLVGHFTLSQKGKLVTEPAPLHQLQKSSNRVYPYLGNIQKIPCSVVLIPQVTPQAMDGIKYQRVWKLSPLEFVTIKDVPLVMSKPELTPETPN